MKISKLIRMYKLYCGQLELRTSKKKKEDENWYNKQSVTHCWVEMLPSLRSKHVDRPCQHYCQNKRIKHLQE